MSIERGRDFSSCCRRGVLMDTCALRLALLSPPGLGFHIHDMAARVQWGQDAPNEALSEIPVSEFCFVFVSMAPN